MKQGIQKSLDQVAEVWSEAEVKFKGLAVYQGNLAARFRVIAASGGVSMMDMVLRTNKQGRLAIANFCNHTMGYDLVEQTRQVAAPMLADIDKSFLERLLNKPGMKPEHFKGFGQLAEKLRSGDMQGVVATYNSLPDQLRDTLAAACIYITALQRSDDTNAYKHALQEAAVRFDSPSFKFMLVDLYAMEGNHGKAADCVDAFMKVVGPDAALLALKSSLLKSKGIYHWQGRHFNRPSNLNLIVSMRIPPDSMSCWRTETSRQCATASSSWNPTLPTISRGTSPTPPGTNSRRPPNPNPGAESSYSRACKNSDNFVPSGTCVSIRRRLVVKYTTAKGIVIARRHSKTRMSALPCHSYRVTLSIGTDAAGSLRPDKGHHEQQIKDLTADFLRGFSELEISPKSWLLFACLERSEKPNTPS
jgi:hypothetical protein